MLINMQISHVYSINLNIQHRAYHALFIYLVDKKTEISFVDEHPNEMSKHEVGVLLNSSNSFLF